MAARTVWKGALSVGLLNVQVGAYVATDDAKGGAPSRTNLHKTCGHALNQQKVCRHCQVADVPMADVDHGVYQPDGTYVLISDDDIKGLKTPNSDHIAVDKFVAMNSIDPLLVSGTYYLAPMKGNAAPFALLREAMVASAKIMTGRVTLGGREQLVAVRPNGRALLLQFLRPKDCVRAESALPEYAALGAPVDVRHVPLALQLIEQLSGEFDASAIEDRYAQAFRDLVESKRTGVAAPVTAAAPQAAPPLDFMAALQASLAAKVVPVAEAVSGLETALPAPAPAKASRSKKEKAA